jgi:hypothetical protein
MRTVHVTPRPYGLAVGEKEWVSGLNVGYSSASAGTYPQGCGLRVAPPNQPT